jgi:hypothetical protein
VTRARPRRRWLRWLALVLLALAAWLAATAWLLSRDRERVAGLVARTVAEATGLRMEVRGAADVSWWPPGVRLGDVRLALPGGGQLAQAEALGASVPWSVLWTREPVLGRIELEGLQIDLDTLAALSASRADGPPAPWRWPKLGERLVVRDAKLVRAGAEPFVVTLEVDPIAVDANVRISAAIATPRRAHRIRIDGVARDDGGLALAPADIDVDGLGFDGALRVASGTAWSAEGRVVATTPPGWLDALLPGATPGAPVDVEIAVARVADALSLRAVGSVGGAKLDADLAGIDVPAGSGVAAWLALATDPTLRGRARVDRWTIGTATLEGIELRAGEGTPR